MAKNKQAMDDDAVDPNMSFKNIMKDVQHFGKHSLFSSLLSELV